MLYTFLTQNLYKTLSIGRPVLLPSLPSKCFLTQNLYKNLMIGNLEYFQTTFLYSFNPLTCSFSNLELTHGAVSWMAWVLRVNFLSVNMYLCSYLSQILWIGGLTVHETTFLICLHVLSSRISGFVHDA